MHITIHKVVCGKVFHMGLKGVLLRQKSFFFRFFHALDFFFCLAEASATMSGRPERHSKTIYLDSEVRMAEFLFSVAMDIGGPFLHAIHLLSLSILLLLFVGFIPSFHHEIIIIFLLFCMPFTAPYQVFYLNVSFCAFITVNCV